MVQKRFYNQLEKEKEKLYRLIDQALKNGIPLSQDRKVQMQTQKVDSLILKSYGSLEKHGREQRER
jgi:thiamine monophosphate synthase